MSLPDLRNERKEELEGGTSDCERGALNSGLPPHLIIRSRDLCLYVSCVATWTASTAIVELHLRSGGKFVMLFHCGCRVGEREDSRSNQQEYSTFDSLMVLADRI